jgi:hypothetical protein
MIAGDAADAEQASLACGAARVCTQRWLEDSCNHAVHA